MRAVTKERSMAFEDVMGTVMRWATATDALAALGAELALRQPDAQAPPEIVRALLAVAAANVWPAANIVGIDPWEASLDRARTNVANAALEARITLRHEDLASVDDTDAFDCVWIPTFFLTEGALADGLRAVVRAL